MCIWSSRRYGSVSSRNASSSPARAGANTWLVTLASSHRLFPSPHHCNDVCAPRNSPLNFPRRERLNTRNTNKSKQGDSNAFDEFPRRRPFNEVGNRRRKHRNYVRGKGGSAMTGNRIGTREEWIAASA